MVPHLPASDASALTVTSYSSDDFGAVSEQLDGVMQLTSIVTVSIELRKKGRK